MSGKTTEGTAAEPILRILADKVNWLIDHAHPRDRGPYTNAEVAALIERTTGEQVSHTTVWKPRAARARHAATRSGPRRRRTPSRPARAPAPWTACRSRPSACPAPAAPGRTSARPARSAATAASHRPHAAGPRRPAVVTAKASSNCRQPEATTRSTWPASRRFHLFAAAAPTQRGRQAGPVCLRRAHLPGQPLRLAVLIGLSRRPDPVRPADLRPCGTRSSGPARNTWRTARVRPSPASPGRPPQPAGPLRGRPGTGPRSRRT